MNVRIFILYGLHWVPPSTLHNLHSLVKDSTAVCHTPLDWFSDLLIYSHRLTTDIRHFYCRRYLMCSTWSYHLRMIFLWPHSCECPSANHYFHANSTSLHHTIHMNELKPILWNSLLPAQSSSALLNRLPSTNWITSQSDKCSPLNLEHQQRRHAQIAPTRCCRALPLPVVHYKSRTL